MNFNCAYCGSTAWGGDPFCDLGCASRWWRQKSTWWVSSIHTTAPPGPVPQPDQWFLDILEEMEETALTTLIRTVLVSNLNTGDRMFLKDLRVLEVLYPPTRNGDELTISYHHLAAQEHGTLTVPRDSKCKIISGGWSQSDQALHDLI